MKKYNTPEMSVVLASKEDIMNLSDTYVNIDSIWPDEGTGDSTGAEG